MTTDEAYALVVDEIRRAISRQWGIAPALLTAAVPVVTAQPKYTQENPIMFANLLRRIRQFLRGDTDTITATLSRYGDALNAHATDSFAASQHHTDLAIKHEDISFAHHAEGARAIKIASNVRKLLEA